MRNTPSIFSAPIKPPAIVMAVPVVTAVVGERCCPGAAKADAAIAAFRAGEKIRS